MQLTNIKISNLLSFPYQANLSKNEGAQFHNRKNNTMNILIGPNGSGKSGFLLILQELIKIGIMHDYVYNKQYISDAIKADFQKTISLHEQYTSGLHPHFDTPDKPSQVIVQFLLTQHDYDNMQYIIQHRELFHTLIKTYSTLDVRYPLFSHEHVNNISSSLLLNCSVDTKNKKIIIDEKKLSPEHQFVLLYIRTIELLQICIDMYNEFHRKGKNSPLIPLKNGIAFITMNRGLSHIPHKVDPRFRNRLIGDKHLPEHYASVGFYLCVKKIWNTISNHSTLKMTKKDKANYPEKLKESEFYVSLSFIIKKYLNKTLRVEYADNLLAFYLIDPFGNYLNFSQLSDGEQSLLSMIFTLYGYDLKDGMLIISEPELHFHPQMQKDLSRMIEKINTNIGTQFIISTYSPLFINETNIGNVYRFANINGETLIKNPFLTLSRDEASLVHLLKFENLSKIFFVNKIILVEGETDAYFFDFYLRHLHADKTSKITMTDYEIININGKGSYKVRNNFLSKFGLQSFFIGDWDNIVDYGFMTQDDISYYYKQTKSYYTGLKKSGKTHRHYNKLVDTIRNLFPKKYRYLVSNIDNLYKKNVFILKKGDIETYLGMSEKGLESTVKFCHYNFKQWLLDKRFDTTRHELLDILGTISK